MIDKEILELNSEQTAAVQDLLDQELKIEAVKLCREYLDCDLVKAKELVDSLQLGTDASSSEPAEMGLMSPLGIAVLLLILGTYLLIR